MPSVSPASSSISSPCMLRSPQAAQLPIGSIVRSPPMAIGGRATALQDPAYNREWPICTSSKYHLTNQLDLLHEIELDTEIPSVYVNPETEHTVVAAGKVKLIAKVGSETFEVVLDNVLYCPEAQRNVFSVSAWDKASFGTVSFGGSRAFLYNQAGAIVMCGAERRGRYVLRDAVPRATRAPSSAPPTPNPAAQPLGENNPSAAGPIRASNERRSRRHNHVQRTAAYPVQRQPAVPTMNVGRERRPEAGPSSAQATMEDLRPRHSPHLGRVQQIEVMRAARRNSRAQGLRDEVVSFLSFLRNYTF